MEARFLALCPPCGGCVATEAGNSRREGKQGDGGSAATAGMKVCERSGREESWECRARQLTPQRRAAEEELEEEWTEGNKAAGEPKEEQTNRRLSGETSERKTSPSSHNELYGTSSRYLLDVPWAHRGS